MALDIRLDGTITAESPIAYSPPDCKTRDGRSLLPRMPVFDGGAMVERPFISGAALRGLIRRASASAILDAAQSAEKPVSFLKFLEIQVGGAKSSGTEDIDPTTRRAVIESDPMLALYGAGTSAAGFVGSKLTVSHLIPDTEVTVGVVRAVRRAEQKHPRLFEVLSEDGRDLVRRWAAANTERSRAARQEELLERTLYRLQRQVNDGKRNANDPELKETRDALAAAKAAHETASEHAHELGGDVSIGLPLPGYEVLPQGTALNSTLTLRGVSEVEAGLFMEGLQRFAFDPVIGAHIAHGCGQIAGSYTVRVRNGLGPWSPEGHLTFDWCDGLQHDSETLSRCHEAWNAHEIDLDALAVS